ncbi:hypothetical protein IFM89_025882 [Coptis chinensis]|uniref:Uncharacterized protein n=1 Tax=Coptis chinensis TaxID=261450 RepID=A0A835LF59_9MAGN|nr:hypothetical protein IFM89_025882 [Coptis chinensis]
MSYLYLYDVTSPAIASIDICRFDEGHRLSKVLNTVSNVRDLTLSDSAVVVISELDLLDHLRAFSSLFVLKVTVGLYQAFVDPVCLDLRQFIDPLCHLPSGVELLLFENAS